MDNQKGVIGVVILLIVALSAVAGGGYFVYQKQKNKVAIPASESQESNKVGNSEKSSNPITTTKQEQKTLVTFEDHLSACSKYKTTFIHPFTEETMEKEILGIIDGKCDYIEQMPNNGKMECKYTESERKAVAQYSRDLATAESFGTDVSAHADFADLESGKQKTKYTINGKIVENPLQEAIDSGVCVISGYWKK